MPSSEFLYSIFTYDYGIIKCVKKYSKREKNLDIGYLVNFEIETKSNKNIHKIRNIKIIGEYTSENKTFYQINTFLELLSYLIKKIPEGNPNYEIFNIYELIIKKNIITNTSFTLIKLKLKNIFGELNIENPDKTVEKILKFINLNKIETIIKLVGIKQQTLDKLSKLI